MTAFATPMTIDLERLGYLARHRREKMGLTGGQVTRLLGLSKRQVSFLENGRPINAGATLMLCELYKLDMADMLTTQAREVLDKVRAVHREHADNEVRSVQQFNACHARKPSQFHAVTPDVPCGTE